MHVRTLGSGLGLGLGLVGMDTVDPCHGQLAAALERAASRVLRYGDESEEGEGWEEREGGVTAAGSVAGTGVGVHAVARGRGGGGAARGRAATSALPTLRFDALLGELVCTLASMPTRRTPYASPMGCSGWISPPRAAVAEPG